MKKSLFFLPLFCAAWSWPQHSFAQGQQPGGPPRTRPTMPPGQINGQPLRPGGLPSPTGIRPSGPQQGGGAGPAAVRLPGGAPVAAPAGLPPGTTPPAGVPVAPRPAAPAGGQTPSGVAPAPSGKNAIAFEGESLSFVLEEYYNVTKRRVLKDRGLENATVTIVVPGQDFTDEEYQSIIEKGLLMHGYALVPSGPNLYKLVAAEQGTTPSSQGVPVILRSEDLPETDQVVSHVIQLNYLQAEEASSALQQLVPLHPYGKILAMANARALVITEASQTIRAYLDLVKQVDVPPMDTMQKTFVLQRATASEVVEQLSTLLGLNNAGGTGGVAPKPQPVAARPATNVPGQPPGLLPPAAGAPAGAGTSASLGGVSPEASKPVIQAIERNNSLIVIARPTDMMRIESLIRELDAESTNRRYFSRRLNYLDLTVFLNIAEKALQRNSKNGSSSGIPQDASSTNRNTTNNNNNSFGNNSGFGSNSFGSGAMGGLGGLGGLGGGGLSNGLGAGSGPQLEVTKKPLSVLIANTLVIADPASSKFFASGPPDQIQALEELADELDVRPRQIFISAIIGELTLSDTFRFGLDWVNTLRSIGEGDLIGGGLNTNGGAFASSGLETIAGAVATGGPLGAAGLTAYGQINRSIGIFIRALEQDVNFHVLQKPTITTLNHQSATIYIGQQIAIAGQTFTNGGVNNGLGFTATTQFIPVRLQLDITPHIYNDTEVMLEFKQQNNGVTTSTTNIGGSEVPNITEQGMVNSLIVPNNATAMLGGLITERDKNNKSGLPFLVRVPVLKHLFGNTDKAKERREMIIFVQPSIMPDNHSHMLQQAKFGDHVQKFEETRAFGGSPNDGVPRADEVREAAPAPPPARPEKPEETKKSFFGRMKSLFTRDKNR